MRSHPGVTIRVESTDSDSGVSVMASGGSDIGMSSRPPSSAELDAARARNGVAPHAVAVALDAVAVFVNMKNPIDRVSLDTLKDMYTGKIREWKKAGSQKGALVACGYAKGTGNREWFREQVLGGADFSPLNGEYAETNGVVSAVMSDYRAVGYGSSAFVKGVRIIRVAKKPNERGFEPSDVAMASGKYPLSRRLFFCFSGAPAGDTASFLEWVLSPEGQRMCRDAGYFPVRPVKHVPTE
jgi:phosphate transport system substrate-binding protein